MSARDVLETSPNLMCILAYIADVYCDGRLALPESIFIPGEARKYRLHQPVQQLVIEVITEKWDREHVPIVLARATKELR
jgi:hypothetical protein